MKVLMVGVDEKRVGGMWEIAKKYLLSETFCKKTDLRYIATATEGSVLHRGFFMLKRLWTIRQVLDLDNPDIVHIHMAEKGSVFRKGMVLKMAKRRGCKVILHLHAGPFVSWYHTLSPSIRGYVLGILRGADLIITLGKYWEQELKTILPSASVTYLYNGVEVPERNWYDLNAKYIVYMGVLKRTKGIYDLLEAMRRINEKLPKDQKLLLCGYDMTGDVEGRIRDSGLSERVQLLGWVDEKEREKLLRSAAISVLPSYFEGLSVAVLEAMAYGVPVVTTDISTMREIVGDRIHLVKPGDVENLASQLLELSDSPYLRQEYSRIEYQRAKTIFRLDFMLQSTLDIYEELLKETAS